MVGFFWKSCCFLVSFRAQLVHACFATSQQLRLIAIFAFLAVMVRVVQCARAYLVWTRIAQTGHLSHGWGKKGACRGTERGVAWRGVAWGGELLEPSVWNKSPSALLRRVCSCSRNRYSEKRQTMKVLTSSTDFAGAFLQSNNAGEMTIGNRWLGKWKRCSLSIETHLTLIKQKRNKPILKSVAVTLLKSVKMTLFHKFRPIDLCYLPREMH